MDHLARIFSGGIENWKAVGGTYAVFRDKVLGSAPPQALNRRVEVWLKR